MTPTELKRFTRKYINTGPGGCWLWMNAKQTHGYGSFSVSRKKRLAHRVAYEHYIGPIPDGMELDHLCRVRGCVNPAHLEPVSHAENMARGAFAMKTHCPQGHQYTANNLVIRKNGTRRCRTCHNARERARYHARKAVAK